MKNLKTKSILACAVLASVLAGGFGLDMSRAEAADETPVFKFKVNDGAEQIWDGTSNLYLHNLISSNPYTGSAKLEVWGEEGAISNNMIVGDNGNHTDLSGNVLSGLTVIFNSGTVNGVYGRYSTSGASLNGETVIINGGIVKGSSSDISAAGVYNLSNGNANNGTLNINGGTFYKSVSGGYTCLSPGDANNNIVNITDGMFMDEQKRYMHVYGGSAKDNANNNQVNISGGYGNIVYGGEGGQSANYNQVNISGGEYESAFGGRGTYGDAKNNIVRISGGKISVRSGSNPTKVVGGWAGNGEVSGNQVILSGGDLSTADVYGWYNANTHSDNTLQIENSVNVSSVNNFENLNFVLQENINDNDTMLALSTGVSLGDVAVNVYLNGQERAAITLIDKASGSLDNDKVHVYTGTVGNSTLTEGYTVTIADNQLVLTNISAEIWYQVGDKNKLFIPDEEAQSISDVNGDVTIYRGAGTDSAYKDINVGSRKLTVVGADDVNSIQVTGNLTAGALEINDGKSFKLNGSADVGQVTLGTGATVIASGDFSGGNMVSVGKNNTMQAVNTVALGSNAVVSGENSVAIGNNSVATEENTVSVGSSGAERRIVNVAAGTADNDAVIVAQLKSAVGNAYTGASGSKGLTYDGTKLVTNVSLTTTNISTTKDAFADNEFVTKKWVEANAGGGAGGGTTYKAGNNISISDDGTISAQVTVYGAGKNITIANGVISANVYADAKKDGDSDENASATGNGAIALGYSSDASGGHSVTIGFHSKASGSDITVVGAGSEAKASWATVLGANNTVTTAGNYATVVGSQSEASGKYAVAVGSSASANSNESVAVGKGTQATADGAMAFGSSARATGAGALGVGSFSESAKRDYAVEYCKETMKRVVQFDPQIEVEPWEKALQLMAEEKGLENCLAMNTQNFIDSINEKLVGGYYFDNYVIDAIAGENGFVGTTASGVNAISIGASTKPQGNMASGNNSIAIGTDARANKNGSIALGAWSVAERTGLGDGIYELSVGGGKDTNDKTVYRVITNVADGTADHDAATYGQVKNLVSATKADDGTITLHKLGDGTTTDNDIVISPSTGDGTGGTTYTAGDNVSISDAGVISATDTTYTADNTNITIGEGNKIILSSTLTGLTSAEFSGAVTAASLNIGNVELTGTKITGYDNHIANNDIHVTAAQKTAWDGYATTIAGNTANITTNTNAISAINDSTTGILASAKSYTDGLTLSFDSNKLSLKNGDTTVKEIDLSGLAGSGGTVDAYTKTETNTLLDAKADKTVVESNTTNIATNTAAIAQNATDIAKNAKDIKDNTALIQKNTIDIATNATAIGTNKTNIETNTANIAALQTAVDGKADTSYVDNAIANISDSVIKPEEKKVAFGTDNVVAKEATAIGHDNKITGENSVAVGAGHKISGKNSGAFGDPHQIYAYDSYTLGNSNILGVEGHESEHINLHVIGNNNKISGKNTFVLGSGVTSSVNNAVILGNGSTATEDNVVSVGAPGAERKIVNVADGTAATDAVNYGQLQAAMGATGTGEAFVALQNDVANMGSQINRMGTRISKVGAGAAALAAMHPVYDPESKLTFSAGVGNYKSETAAAVGLFYRFDDRVMLNFGASVGNDNDMYNMGLNFALGRHTPKGLPTKQVMYQQLVSLQTLLNEQKAENAAMHNENSTMRELLLKQSAENAAIKEQIDAQKAQHDAQIAQLLAMIEELKNR